LTAEPAARVSDRFGHDAALEGLAAGLAVGVLLAGGVIATGGLGALAIGAALATTGLAGLAGEMIGRSLPGPTTGQLALGSPDVFINGRTCSTACTALAPSRRGWSASGSWLRLPTKPMTRPERASRPTATTTRPRRSWRGYG
jgi:hypothetical protein